jgi:hypothetical protein
LNTTGGGEDVHLAADLLVTEARLIQTAGAGARQVARGQRAEFGHRERLQGSQHLRPARLLHPVQQLQVGLDRCRIDDEARRRHAGRIEVLEGVAVHGRAAPALQCASE